MRAIIAEIGVMRGRIRVYLQDSSIKTSKKRNANFVSKLTSLGVYCAEGGKRGDEGQKSGSFGWESGF